jgi:hypothetical protein
MSIQDQEIIFVGESGFHPLCHTVEVSEKSVYVLDWEADLPKL